MVQNTFKFKVDQKLVAKQGNQATFPKLKIKKIDEENDSYTVFTGHARISVSRAGVEANYILAMEQGV